MPVCAPIAAGARSTSSPASAWCRRMGRRRYLAPLDPDAFLAWGWSFGDRRKGSRPLTVESWHFEVARHDPELTTAEVRRGFVRVAARVRRNQRLGLDPWEGLR
jgi:hypothetical protein